MLPPKVDEVDCVPNYTVGTLTQLLGHIVSLVNDELLVEDLEHFTAL